MREYNYSINYLKIKDDFVAYHLFRAVRIIVRPPEASCLGLDKPKNIQKQREDAVWGELIEYLKGGKVTSKRLPKATLHQFVLANELLYYVREKTDGRHGLRTPALQHAHELFGHLGQKKTIRKAERIKISGPILKQMYVTK